MNDIASPSQPPRPQAADKWLPLHFSLGFILKNPRILGLSLLLVVLTGILTWIGYLEAVHLIDSWTGGFFTTPPESSGAWGWFVVKGWVVGKYLFLIISRTVSFYLAFLLAYCLTSPGYVFLSSATEKKFAGGQLSLDDGLSLKGMIVDLIEGCKIGLLGVLVTVSALLVNFVPVVGQGLVFLLYTFYSALMFVDYPASNRRWTLGKKMAWIRSNRNRSFRLGLLPALISLIPIINILFMALLFPLFTVHTTLNFVVVEDRV